jgi:hypothetical protein
MFSEDCPPVEVSRRIGAPAPDIFRFLADPGRHVELDGSGMVRGTLTTRLMSGVGDVFVMRMYYPRLGDYEMNNHIVEYELNRRIGWEPEAGRGHPDEGSPAARWGHRWSYVLSPDQGSTLVTEVYDCSRVPEAERRGMDNGQCWIESMAATLERLDKLCADC